MIRFKTEAEFIAEYGNVPNWTDSMNPMFGQLWDKGIGYFVLPRCGSDEWTIDKEHLTDKPLPKGIVIPIIPIVKIEDCVAYKAAVSYFGDTLVDIQENADMDEHELLILFPEILIKDPIKTTHLIKDLILKLSIVENKVIHLRATRLTYSDVEWARNQYIHSHVNGHPWGSFCLGSSDVRSLISDSQTGEFTEDMWCLLFLTLENFLQIEGTQPYKRIKELTLSRATGGDDHFDKELYFKKFKTVFPNYNYNISINSLSDKPFQIELNHQFYKDFALVLDKKYKGIYNTNTDTANIQTKDSHLFIGDLVNLPPILFKGINHIKKVYSTVELAELEPDYPFPHICRQIEDYYQTRINNTINESYRTTSENRTSDLQKYLS